MRRIAFITLLLISQLSLAADPVIHFPDASQVTPAPQPAAIPSLAEGQILAISCDPGVIERITVSPSGALKKSKRTNASVFGVFIDSKAGAEWRDFKGDVFLFTVNSGATADHAEILIYPKGSNPDDEPVRYPLDIGSTSPAPTPPAPTPPAPTPPAPTPPKPKPVAAVQPLHILIVEDTLQASIARGQLLSNSDLMNRIKARGHSFRCVDKAIVDQSGQTPADLQKYFKLATTLPTLFIVGNDAAILYQGSVPDAAGIGKLLDSFGG